jgi:hypothetical protein
MKRIVCLEREGGGWRRSVIVMIELLLMRADWGRQRDFQHRWGLEEDWNLHHHHHLYHRLNHPER